MNQRNPTTRARGFDVVGVDSLTIGKLTRRPAISSTATPATMRFCIGCALRPLILVAILSGHTVAAFKSSSSNVGTGSDRSSLLNYLNDANGEPDDDSSVALNDIAGDATLQLVADFFNSVGAHQVHVSIALSQLAVD